MKRFIEGLFTQPRPSPAVRSLIHSATGDDANRTFKLVDFYTVFLRAVTIIFCLFLVGCEHDRTRFEVKDIYASALSELAPALDHYTIVAKKVEFGADDLAPDMQQVNEHGAFSFSDSNGLLTADILAGLSVTLLSDSDFDELDSDDCETFWGDFRAKHTESTGFLRVSDVGFDESGNKAIFYLEGRGGCLSGQGSLVIMSREDDRWVVVEKLELWVS